MSVVKFPITILWFNKLTEINLVCGLQRARSKTRDLKMSRFNIHKDHNAIQVLVNKESGYT